MLKEQFMERLTIQKEGGAEALPLEKVDCFDTPESIPGERKRWSDDEGENNHCKPY